MNEQQMKEKLEVSLEWVESTLSSSLSRYKDKTRRSLSPHTHTSRKLTQLIRRSRSWSLHVTTRLSKTQRMSCVSFLEVCVYRVFVFIGWQERLDWVVLWFICDYDLKKCQRRLSSVWALLIWTEFNKWLTTSQCNAQRLNLNSWVPRCLLN